MTSYLDLKKFLEQKKYKIIIAADAEPVVHKKSKDKVVTGMPAGGVAVAFDPIARASNALFIGRGKTNEDKLSVDSQGKIKIDTNNGAYTLKRLFFNEQEIYDYYYGFSNQTLWPLCHVAFEKPIFSSTWYEGYKAINKKFAEAIKEEINGPTLIWLNDYQLTLVPEYLGKIKNVTIGIFWHIPWPTWEIFRILPQKKEILESLLKCDYIAFHRRYQRRNFSQTVERELEARIDLEMNRIYYNNHITTINNLPMGVDTDVIKSLMEPETQEKFFSVPLQAPDEETGKELFIESLFKDTKVILGIDRLDYTKGLLLRLQAIDLFFEYFPQFKEKISYVSILAPSRQEIPSYLMLHKQILIHANAINKKYSTSNWQPINLLTGTFARKEIMELYRKAAVCLVTPLDDGMNLVSKEFVIAASLAKNPGMLVLSQFAGSAIDLTESIIINPYDVEEVAKSIKKAIEMPKKEKEQRIHAMANILEVRNVYEWGQSFIQEAEIANQQNR